MFRFDPALKVYLHREAVDGRKNINGLALLVEQALGLDPFAPALDYFLVHGSGHFRFNEARCNGVAANVAAAQLLGE